MASAIPAYYLLASPNHRRWNAGAWPIQAYNRPELAGPGKSSSGVTKSREMTYRGLANSGLWQTEIS
jgi:hypothetical protein